MAYLLRGEQVSDFRSDTVTRPSPAMRRAMAEAEVGDDVFEDDPTVQRLEARAAEAFGKEAGLFVASGSMANLVAIMTHTQPGEEVILEARSHTYLNEVGGAARIAGVLTRTLEGTRGALDPEVVRRAILAGNLHNPRTGLVCAENTHNFHGGAITPLAKLQALHEVARARGVPVHLDGARIWNAVTATGVAPREWGGCCETLMFCLSKGLGAPVGSLLLGPREWIAKARRNRKVVGGGMRQVGVLAAAGLVALDEGPRQMQADHANARRLSEGLARIPGAVIDPAAVETNILFLRTEAGPESYARIVEGLAAERVLAFALGDLGIRLVTHKDVDAQDVDRALDALGRLVPAVCGEPVIRPAVLVHGGAGVMRSLEGGAAEAYRAGLAAAARAGLEALARGESALAAVVAAARHMEASGAFNAGKGACLDEDGQATLDAALMRGADRAAGAVGALSATLHPTDVCLDLLQEGRHVLLVGEGADRRARALQLAPLPPPAQEQLATWKRMKEQGQQRAKPEQLGSVGRPDDQGAVEKPPAKQDGDTVGAVAVDAQGRVAAAVTTGGLWLKATGRVGDSAIPGAGLFACDALGAASSTTGIGERMIRSLTARVACDLVSRGASAAEAAKGAIEDVHDRLGPDSGGIIVVDRQGRIGAAFDTRGMGRALARSGDAAVPVAIWPDDPFPAE